MSYKELQQKFNELGYDLIYKLGTDGQGYYARQHGSSDEVYYHDLATAEQEVI